MESRIKARGRVRIYVDGQLVGDHHNLVVDTGLLALVKAAGGDQFSHLVAFEGGTGTTAPAAGDTALETSVFWKALTSITYPGPGQMKATATILPGEATGEDFTEFGLLCVGGDLFARIVDGITYSKTALNTITLVWDIILTT